MSSQSPVNLFVRNHAIFVENCIKLILSGCPREFSHRDMYIAPSSGHNFKFDFNMPFKLILRRCEVTRSYLMSGVKIQWHFFERLMEIHSNSP